jgi:hypothetical protein
MKASTLQGGDGDFLKFTDFVVLLNASTHSLFALAKLVVAFCRLRRLDGQSTKGSSGNGFFAVGLSGCECPE